MNLSAVSGGANALITDSVVQEIDIKTGLVMWEWHALGHIPVGESKNPVPGGNYPWDYVHVNSIDPGPAGDVLISARNTWGLYDIDIRSGGVRWRLGGANSSFALAPGTRFYWQHDAEFQPGGLISLFDNASDPPKEPQSRGLLLRPDAATHTVALVNQFVNPTRTLLAESQGNALSLPAGNWLLGYGGLPNFTEFDPAGHVLLDGTLGRNVQDFKTFLSPWSAKAPGAPALSAQPNGAGGLSVSMSWNGATDVSSWRVLAGSAPGSLAALATGAKTGFQTTIEVESTGPYVQAQALDRSGAVIGVSATAKL
jgi:arylsulfotransferase ASST